MSVNVSLALADWFADATHGVAALVASVPLETGFTVGTVAGIYDDARHSVVTRQQVPDSDLLPALLVQGVDANDGPVALNPFPGDQERAVVIRYVLHDSDTAAALIAADSVERALSASLSRLFRTAAGDTARTRNQTQITGLRSWQVRTMRSNDDTILTLAILATFTVRDVWASA